MKLYRPAIYLSSDCSPSHTSLAGLPVSVKRKSSFHYPTSHYIRSFACPPTLLPGLFFHLPISDPPAAFTRSPEPSEDNPESLPLPPDLADRSHSQWHPLQQRQCQPRWKTDTVSSGSNSGYSAAGNNRTDAAPPPSLSSLTVESGVLRHAIREQVSST